MIADSDESHPRDSRILCNYSMEDIDKETLTQYRQLFANLKPSHPWLSLNDLEFLTKLEAYRKDRHTKEEGFTLAGILMFGKQKVSLILNVPPIIFPTTGNIWEQTILLDGRIAFVRTEPGKRISFSSTVKYIPN